MIQMSIMKRINMAGGLFFSHVASFSRLTARTVYWSFVAPFRRRAYTYTDLMFQLERVGIKSFSIIALVMFLIGMILVMQSAYVVEPYGQMDLVAGGVAVSITREIGPLVVAVVVTGRVGAAFAAELGAQYVSDEVTALQSMGINPIGFLIAPRFIALLVMLPVLTVYGNFMGMFGGYLMGTLYYGIAHSVYLDATFDLMKNQDIISGILKSMIFAVIICMVGCYKGLTVRGGPIGVGKSTMEAVVISIVLIIMSDAVFTGINILYWP